MNVGPPSGLQCRRWAGVARPTLLSGECKWMYAWCSCFYMTFYICIPVQCCGLHTIPLLCYTRISIYHAVIYHPAFYLEFYVLYIYMCVCVMYHNVLHTKFYVFLCTLSEMANKTCAIKTNNPCYSRLLYWHLCQCSMATKSVSNLGDQWSLLLTYFNFNPSIDK